MGSDEVILLSDRAFAGSDTLATSCVLAGAIKKLGDVDLVFCGKQAIDGDTAQVGPGVARRLGLNQLTYVCSVDTIDPAARTITVKRLLESGREVVQTGLPAMLTVVKDINQPRFPSVLKLRKAQHAEIPTWGLEEIEAGKSEVGLDGSATQVVRIFTPEVRKSGEPPLKEEPEKAVAMLLSKLYEKKIL
jgi:electron transfer flavoprotein beta subunit